MKPLIATFFLSAIFTASASAVSMNSNSAYNQAVQMSAATTVGSQSGMPEVSHAMAGTVSDGTQVTNAGIVADPSGNTVGSDVTLEVPETETGGTRTEPESPSGEEGEEKGWTRFLNPMNWPSWGQYGGAALAGAGIGAAVAGIPGAIVGAGLAAAGLMFAKKGELYTAVGVATGAVAGWMIGAAAGSAMGPVGAVVGAVLGLMWGKIFQAANSTE